MNLFIFDTQVCYLLVNIMAALTLKKKNWGGIDQCWKHYTCVNTSVVLFAD